MVIHFGLFDSDHQDHDHDDDVPVDTGQHHDVQFGADTHHADAGFSGTELANQMIAHEAAHHPDPADVAAGNEIAANIMSHIDHMVYGTSEVAHHEAQAAAGNHLMDKINHDKPYELQFGAGTCSHCGGLGYTTWPSSGSQERCWYCNGSGGAR